MQIEHERQPNARQVVADGYDRIADKYLRLVAHVGNAVREKYLAAITSRLPAGANVLEMGCGAGVPMTQALAQPFAVTAIDIAPRQLALAAANVPAARLALADMASLPFASGVFDAVTAFYSITHVPRAQHASLLAEVTRVLRPGGWLVATLGYADTPDMVEPDWLGAPMFFSHYDAGTNVELVRQAGFAIISAADETEQEYSGPVCFRWVVARKPAGAGHASSGVIV